MAMDEDELYAQLGLEAPQAVTKSVEQPMPIGVQEPVSAPEASPYKIQNPLVQDWAKKLYGDKYSDEARQKIIDENNEDAGGLNWGAAFASLGAGLQGKDAAAAGAQRLSAQAAARENRLKQFDTGRDSLVRNEKLGMEMRDDSTKQAKLERERNPTSKESLLAQDLAKKMLPGKDFSGMNAEEIMTHLPTLKTIFEATQKSADRAVIREGQQALRDEKKGEKELALAVPGYERTGEVLPKAEEAAKLRTALASASQLKSKLNRLKELVKEHGSYEYGGQGGTEMESLATEIQLISKSPEMYQLGVLTGPDMTLLQKITADPTSMSSLFTRDNSRQKQIDTQLGSIDNKLSAVTQASGYRPKGQDNRLLALEAEMAKRAGGTKTKLAR